MQEAHSPARGKATEQDMVDRAMRRWEAAKADRGEWTALWDELAAFVRPSRDLVYSPDRGQTPRDQAFLFDGTAISANMVLASGCMSRLTPAQTPWFAFDPPRAMQGSDTVKRWYAECTEIAIEALATSNFYTEIHECYLDRGGFGTSLLHCEGGTDHPLTFKAEDIGHYAVLNGADGRVDTVFRQMELTARQAAQRYPVEKLPQTIRDELAEPRAQSAKHEFVQVIYPREDAERDGNKLDGANKPVASLHIYVKEKLLVRNSGYDEMPSLASRYLRWGNSAYGICPAWMALPEMRQLNELQMNLDVLAGVAAFPRILVPNDLEGEVDLRQSGATYIKDMNRVPKEWATSGDYRIGLDRVQARKEAIREAFHVELFRMWAQITKQMTAHEVSARENEKIELFSPTFTLLTSELYGPLLRRVFALLLRQGVFPQPPDEAVYVNARGRHAIPDPAIRYTSRLALALKAVHATGMQRTLGMFTPLLEQHPELLDNFNLDRAMRDTGINEGVPVEWMPAEDEVMAIREARAKAQAEQQAKMEAMQQAEMTAKLAQSGVLNQGGGR